ncbi:hypothetical protein QBC37DRAFT_289826 [Rhypophila decipiens]|uniref:25S rRNA (Uridine(2843)-N(3))-methyltransferase n=1 Tax=Rhypophila decipiens TaxID=261697 RepID=A0AAN7B6A6_9PEZI|nr:hypothetical protein QBC37DRAFT_289826 [Rhypophila decipiens]
MAGKRHGRSSATARPGTKSKDDTKKTSAKKVNASSLSSKPSNSQNQETGGLSRRHQQVTLNIFKDTFSSILASDTLSTTLQTIKQALFERDFTRAFGDADSLAVYAARWSPTRALGYASIFHRIYEQDHLQGLILPALDDQSQTTSNVLKLLCIGGGAAEIVAFGSFLGHIHQLSGTITLLDSGPWGQVVSQLQTSLTSLPQLSKYAGQALQQSNKPMISPAERLQSRFIQQDVLALDKVGLTEVINSTTPILATLLFTLNELFTTSGILKTTTFLLNLTATLPLGSLLLVVDSPGSYSETSVGKYPMQWLLDKVLLNTEHEPVEGRAWVKLESHDSLWFRLPDQPQGLDYPIALENMRYQLHLYRLVDAASLEDT